MAIHGSSEGHSISQAFYGKYFISILEHIFAVVADSNQVHIAGLASYVSYYKFFKALRGTPKYFAQCLTLLKRQSLCL